MNHETETPQSLHGTYTSVLDTLAHAVFGKEWQHAKKSADPNGWLVEECKKINAGGENGKKK